MSFTEEQIAALSAPLDPKYVKPPPQGKYGEYIEGWHAIAEANRIFGFGSWHRETVINEETCRYETTIGRNREPGWKVGYRAKVRVEVFADGSATYREGTGFGSGAAKDLADAIESAAKEAETDAMKRALMTFGNPFGLALYDKTKANVRAANDSNGHVEKKDLEVILALIDKNPNRTAEEIAGLYEIASLDKLPAAKAPALMKRLEEELKETA